MDERIFEEIRTWARQKDGKVGAFIVIGESGSEYPLNDEVLAVLSEEDGPYGDNISFVFRELN